MERKVVFRGESVVDAAQQADCLSHEENDEVQQDRDEGNNGKRRREEELSDSDSSFYGFPADSFIFQEQTSDRLNFEDANSEIQENLVRKSERRSKKKRKKDFVYY